MPQKWLTMEEAWILANKLKKKLDTIEAVAIAIGCSFVTIYRWRKGGKKLPDARLTLALLDLAKKHGVAV